MLNFREKMGCSVTTSSVETNNSNLLNYDNSLVHYYYHHQQLPVYICRIHTHRHIRTSVCNTSPPPVITSLYYYCCFFILLLR